MYRRLFDSDPPPGAAAWSDDDLVRLAILKKRLGGRKVVANMTTIPPRFEHIPGVLERLKTHLIIDSVRVLVPQKYRSFDPAIVPRWATIVPVDYGPATRYVFAEGDVVVSLDDDTEYSHVHSLELVEKVLTEGGAWGGSGFNLDRYFVGDYSKRNGPVQVLEGYGMIALLGSDLCKVRDDMQSNDCLNDDLMLSNFLEGQGVQRNLLHRDVKQHEYGMQADALHKRVGSHQKNNLTELLKLRKAGKMHFKPMVTYAVTVCNEHQELRTLLGALERNIVHSDEIRVLVDSGKVTNEVYKVLADFPWVQQHMRKFQDDFADHRNYLNSVCKGRFVFALDADEVPAADLVRNLYQVLANDFDLAFVPRVNFIPGISQEELKFFNFQVTEFGAINWPDMQGRIYRNDPSIKWEAHLHEKVQGANKVLQIQPNPMLALWHIKTVEKMHKQHQHYLEIDILKQS